MGGEIDPVETLAMLAIVIRWARVGLALVGFAAGALMFWRMVADSAVLRNEGVNGEIAMLYEGWRRDAAVLMIVTALLTLMGIKTPASVTSDSLSLAAMSLLAAWVGIQRLRDRRKAELAAAKRRAKERA